MRDPARVLLKPQVGGAATEIPSGDTEPRRRAVPRPCSPPSVFQPHPLSPSPLPGWEPSEPWIRHFPPWAPGLGCTGRDSDRGKDSGCTGRSLACLRVLSPELKLELSQGGGGGGRAQGLLGVGGGQNFSISVCFAQKSKAWETPGRFQPSLASRCRWMRPRRTETGSLEPTGQELGAAAGGSVRRRGQHPAAPLTLREEKGLPGDSPDVGHRVALFYKRNL